MAKELVGGQGFRTFLGTEFGDIAAEVRPQGFSVVSEQRRFDFVWTESGDLLPESTGLDALECTDILLKSANQQKSVGNALFDTGLQVYRLLQPGRKVLTPSFGVIQCDFDEQAITLRGLRLTIICRESSANSLPPFENVVEKVGDRVLLPKETWRMASELEAGLRVLTKKFTESGLKPGKPALEPLSADDQEFYRDMLKEASVPPAEIDSAARLLQTLAVGVLLTPITSDDWEVIKSTSPVKKKLSAAFIRLSREEANNNNHALSRIALALCSK